MNGRTWRREVTKNGFPDTVAGDKSPRAMTIWAKGETMNLTYLPAIVVLIATVVPCVFLFRKWLKEDAEQKNKSPDDSK